MPLFRLLERSYVDDKLLEVGEIIDFDGLPGPHMEPYDPKAVAEPLPRIANKVDNLLTPAPGQGPVRVKGK